MKIEKIKIENFRGILDAELEFDSQLNVFIGGNGAGKTTMLRAIASCLAKLIGSFTIVVNEEFQLTKNDINYSKDYSQLTSNISIVGSQASIPLSVTVGKLSKQVQKENDLKERAFEKFKKYFGEKLNQYNPYFPIIKFYPAHRGSVTYTDKVYTDEEIYSEAQIETWSNIYQDNVSYSRFLKWFFEHETEELRLKRDKNDINIEIPKVAFIRRAIKKAFKILYGKDYKLKSDQIRRRGNNSLIPSLTLENLHTNVSENLSNRSDGEKAIITLIADIAYNLSIAKDFSEGDDYLSSPGIVLIDEIEAHLHPNWQREIIPLLTQLFPNIQFFITTHSPQVLSSVESQHVFICEDFEFSKINVRSKGMDSNSLLKYVFNSTERPKKYVELIEKFDDIIEKEGGIDELQAIIAEINELNTDDKGQDIDLLVNDLNLQMEAYKFDLAHETH